METGARKPNPAPESEIESIQNSENDAFFTVHRQMVIFLFFATLILGALLVFILFQSSKSLLIAIALAGAGGGFVSAMRRLYSFQRVFPSKLLCNWPRQASVSIYVAVYSLIPPLVGAMAAVVLYLIFGAGLVQGDLFPTFSDSHFDPKQNPFENFLWNWSPDSPTSYAKSFVWAFIAGFSERFVPDLLGRLSNRKGNQTN